MTKLLERDFESFFETPFRCYAAESPYVSPMKADLKRFLSLGNPLFASDEDFTYFTAVRNGKPCGRISAHVHRASNDLHSEKRGCFGFFDCADDPMAAELLLSAAERWAAARGMKVIEGNFNLTAMQQAGIMTSGYDATPYTDQIWGAPYLPRLLEENGYIRRFPMTSFELDLASEPLATPLSPDVPEGLQHEGFTLAEVSRRTVAERLEDARTILNVSFRDNPMFVPVSAEEFQFQAKDMKWVMDPRISKVVHYHGRPAGAVIAIPDLNPLLRSVGSRFRWSLPWHYWKYRRSRSRAVVIFQGVLPEFQRRMVNPWMLSEMARSMRDAGYQTVGGTWIADVNAASLRQVEKMGAKPLHRLHLFRKAL